ncbi:uncharacterized protein MONOS_2563 [Monocercomonoides exilis]|uniref:uncharacterized protein n=1 Tax=Monocercomonoides exilis TaxID=2049356 RepID=UPI00355A598C|nr:hypothetical protein MONOS_2563 [Monocercomonoides exilis]|eukprot:MONOS_2563.1-p1 / transcript=MONOS_2563.1 / gene=MONOS_2563 / organism=Monocercomonoides_exilis_PA203 / gene_product=unspecified product / transcript_product=unspecified product / location=Mono_scaffold00053:142908-143212(+) / protein_length=75 / sequence_SO=supercontig / SO=protein_coding / is_pseudo=false
MICRQADLGASNSFRINISYETGINGAINGRWRATKIGLCRKQSSKKRVVKIIHSEFHHLRRLPMKKEDKVSFL